MSRAETFEVSTAAAETYEGTFVPAIFAEWAPLLVEAAEVRPGHVVLDVACGTGVVARTVADRLGGDGRVLGLDRNPAMLTVAARVRPDLEWRVGDVARLPFADHSFDAVLCQMALMFFPDRVAALREMARVCAPDGVVGVVVPAGLDAQPAYRRFVEVAVQHAGPEAASLLGAYWSCGDEADLRTWFGAAGLDVVALRTRASTARFAGPDDLVATEINGSPLAELVGPAGYERIRAGTSTALSGFVAADGSFAPPLHGHLVTGRPAATRPPTPRGG